MIKKEKTCPICGSTFELEIVKEVEDEFRFKKAYEQGRADAIDEILKTIPAATMEIGEYGDGFDAACKRIMKRIKQLKEKK